MFKGINVPGIVALLLTTLLLEACGWQLATPTPTNEPPQELTDRSLLTGVPCRAPCWQGLHLGITSKAEALEVAQALPFIDPTHFPEESDTYVEGPVEFPSRQPATFVQLPCRMPPGRNCAGLRFVNDLLMEVFLLPNYHLTLGAIVRTLGNPDFVQLIPVSHHTTINERLCDVALIWKQAGVRAAFLNTSIGVEVHCDEVRGGQNLDPNLPAKQITYSLPDSLAIDSVPQIDRDFAWTGFAVP